MLFNHLIHSFVKGISKHLCGINVRYFRKISVHNFEEFSNIEYFPSFE